MLYKRDYKILTIDEQNNLQKAEDYFNRRKGKFGEISTMTLFKYHQLKPDASYYFESLFPNNFLFSKNLEDKKTLKQIGQKFESFLNTQPSERQILNFINDNKYYNLVASIFHAGYTFGHHDAYLFKEFEFPSTYKADYLLVGKNSDGYHYIFVEFENLVESITTKDGEFGSTIRKGVKQVSGWDKWIEGNFNSLSLIFQKYKNKAIELPIEFHKLNKSRLNYVVVCGRRQNFNKITYEEKRRLLRMRNINLLHYDNLLDSYNIFQTTNNY